MNLAIYLVNKAFLVRFNKAALFVSILEVLLKRLVRVTELFLFVVQYSPLGYPPGLT